MIVAGDNEYEKQILTKTFATQFEMKDLGKLKYFLKIEVAYSIYLIEDYRYLFVIITLKLEFSINRDRCTVSNESI